MEGPNRRRWPRLTLVLSPDSDEALRELAAANYRDRHREAMRLVLEGIARERPARERRQAAE